MEWRRFVTYLSNDPRNAFHVTVNISDRNSFCTKFAPCVVLSVLTSWHYSYQVVKRKDNGEQSVSWSCSGVDAVLISRTPTIPAATTISIYAAGIRNCTIRGSIDYTARAASACGRWFTSASDCATSSIVCRSHDFRVHRLLDVQLDLWTHRFRTGQLVCCRSVYLYIFVGRFSLLQTAAAWRSTYWSTARRRLYVINFPAHCAGVTNMSPIIIYPPCEDISPTSAYRI